MHFNLVNDQEQVAVCQAWHSVALRGVALALGFIVGGA